MTQKKALVVIDIQNDITKNYRDIIDNINKSIDWAVKNNIHVVYIRHENLSAGTRTFKPDTRGAELVSDWKIVYNYKVNVISDCITSYDKKKIDEMLHYYESKGSKIISLNNLL
jgi:nicotinamidase-related amidase